MSKEGEGEGWKGGEGGSDIGLGHLLGGALAPETSRPIAGKMRNCEQTEAGSWRD